MNRSKIIIKNSGIALIGQVIVMIFNFITRSIFIKYLGVELLGISSTFTSVLSTLSLADLGFQTAIVYSLYRPLKDNDKNKINDIINIYRYIYRLIGYFFIIAGVVCLPFIKYIIKGIEVTNYVYFIFLMLVLNSVCTYFLAYKRSLLYADQKEYISKLIDIGFNVIFNILKIIVIIYQKNYTYYLILQIFQTIGSNLLVHYICRKIYPYLTPGKINVHKLKLIWVDVKNIFASKLAAYVYSSTDNLVISIFINTTSVGYLVNYTTVTNSLKTLVNSMLNPIAAVVGNMLVDNNSKDNKLATFKLYTHIRYIIAAIIIIPTIILMQDFITFCFGIEYLMNKSIVFLLAIDLYIHIVHSACYDYINGSGLFKYDKYIEILGAVVNIIFSIILAQLLGITGVLVGTIISQCIFWIGRSILLYKYSLKVDKNCFAKYWVSILFYTTVFNIDVIVAQFISGFIKTNIFIVRLFEKGVLCEIIFILSYLLFLRKIEEAREFVKIIKCLINKAVRK